MTTIEWVNRPGTKPETWNPIVGCSLASPGCTNCYAMDLAGRRLDREDGPRHYRGTTKKVNGKHVWTGKVALAEHKLKEPLQWTKPGTIFVNSMSDLFHESIHDIWIDRVLSVIAAAPQHTFIVLTKRAARMRDHIAAFVHDGDSVSTPDSTIMLHGDRKWPLTNLWLGVSCERQQEADARIPALLATPAAVRFVSCEPLLGPIDFNNIAPNDGYASNALKGYRHDFGVPMADLPARLDWVIVGGESGPGARPMHPAWARSIREQCQSANVPFFFKQWGEYVIGQYADGTFYPEEECVGTRVAWGSYGGTVVTAHGCTFQRIGKKHAGRLLDGRTWDEMPAGVRASNAMEMADG